MIQAAGEVVKNYLREFSSDGARDVTVLRSLLAPGLLVRSPLGDFSSAADFLADAIRDRLMIDGIQIDKMITEGGRVSVLYRLASRDPDISEIEVAEWFEVEAGRITSITSSFDTSKIRTSLMKI